MPNLIAIVDDDDSVREALASLMISHGYAVTTYASAEDFMSSTLGPRVGCLITDVNLPGLSGVELYEALAERGTNAPTIFVTAFANERVRRRALDLGECFLTKPFSEERLMECVRDAIDRSGS